MAAVTKVVRVANPRKRVRRNNAATRRRRKMSAKQIRIFGTPAQKAALKRKFRAKRVGKTKKSNPTRKSSPRRKARNRASRPKVKVIYRSRPKKKRRTRRTNPALVVTLGSVNPRKRRTKKVAATKKRRKRRTKVAKNTRRRRHHNVRRRRRNARRVTVVNVRRRRSNPRRRRHNAIRRRHHRRHRNPALFGRSSPKDLLKMIGGGLIGVTLTKMVPSYIAKSGLTSSLPQGGFMNVLISAISAWLGGYLIGKFDKELGEAAMFGGFMQTGSVALNTFLPSVGGTFSLGDLVDGHFVVPQNPLYGMGGGGMAGARAAYPSAY